MRLFIREKILFVEKTHDKKKEESKPKISGEFETELLTIFNTLKLNASISGDDEDTFDVLSELGFQEGDTSGSSLDSTAFSDASG